MDSLSAQVLSRLEPVGGLSAKRLEELAAFCRPEKYPLGSDPFQVAPAQGQLIYLLDGELKIVLSDGSRRVMVGGCDSANWPIGYKTVFPISSKAITDLHILRLDFGLLELMMIWDDLSADRKVDDKSDDASLWHAMSGAFSAQVLVGRGLALLPPAHLHELMTRFQRIKVKRGEVLVREGGEGDYYYLIESGRCEVRRRIGGADVRVAELKAGEAFGEEALVSDVKRNAAVVMKTDGALLRLAKEDFVELLRKPLLHSIAWADAERRVAEGRAIWLDIRYAAEFSENGLPGAVNIPLNEIRAAFSLLDKAREYIVYCQSGRRSSTAAFLLAQHGFKAYWLDGGLGDWEKH